MQIEINRAALVSALGNVNSIVPAKHPKDVYRCVRIVADAAGVSISGTDGEVSIVCGVDGATVERPGVMVVPAARLLAIVRELPYETAMIGLEDEQAVIQSGLSDFAISTVKADEFPLVGEFNEAAYVSVDAAILRDALRRTIIAVDVASTHYALGGVAVEIGESSVVVVATDSRRLSVVELEAGRSGDTQPREGDAVIPAKAVKLIDAVLGDSDATEPVKIALRKNDCVVQADGATVTSRLVEGRFPKWRQVVPADSHYTLTIPASELLACVRQAQLMTSVDSRGIDLEFKEGTLSMAAKAVDVGAARIDMPIDFRGEPVTIIFDPKYLADPLRLCGPGVSVEWSMRNGEQAALMRIGSAWRYVLMPLARERG